MKSSKALSARWTPATEWHKPLVLAVLLAVVVFVVYLQVWRFAFLQFDDPFYVSGNRHVQAGLTLEGLKWSFAGVHDANWVPLTWLSLMLDADLWGTFPGGFHLTNVVLHVLDTLLVFAVFALATENTLRSAFVAALFGLHPLHVESVAWIAERKDVLSTLFGLLSLLAYVQYARGKRRWNLALSLVWFTCSLTSKQTLVTLPFVFLLFDFWPLKRLGWGPPPAEAPAALAAGGARESRVAAGDVPKASPPNRAVLWLIVEKLPFLALTVAFSAVAVIAQKSEHAIGTFKDYPMATRLMNAPVVYVAYLAKTFLPVGLSAFYPLRGAALTWTAAGAAAVLLSAISLVSILSIRRLPFLFVGWAWYLGTLVPLIGIVQIGGQQMADRYTYFPLIGIFVAVAWLVPALATQPFVRPRILPGAAWASLCLLAAITFVQIGYWSDSVTLFRRALRLAPDDTFVMTSLGYALVKQNDVSEGLALLERAVHIPPPSANTHFSLAMGLQQLGRLDEAAAEYRASLAIDDRDEEAHNNLAVILSGRRQYAEARQHLLRAIEINPDYLQSYVNLGVLSMATGRYADAISFSQRALALDPLLTACRSTIAMALRAQGRFDEAISQYRYLVQVSPGDRQARMELERTLMMKRESSGP